MPTILELFKNKVVSNGTVYSEVKKDTETLVEQETTGIRKNTGVELNTPRLYGNETIRIITRTTPLLDDMKGDVGGGGLVGNVGKTHRRWRLTQ